MKKLALTASAIFSALLMWAIYPPMGETCALAFALVPLLVVCRMARPKCAAIVCGASGFLFWFATLCWMLAVSKNNGPLPLVILGWFGLSSYCALYFAAFGYLSSRAWQRFGKAAIFLEPVLWGGLEWLRSWLFTGFAWNFLGTAAAQIPNLATPAKLGGVFLVSALVVLLNGVFATLVCRIIAQMLPNVEEKCLERWDNVPGTRWKRLAETAVPLALIILTFWLVTLQPTAREYVPLRAALVQRNAPCIFSRRDKSVDPFDVYDKLLETASVAKPDIIVWAESSMAEFGSLDSSNAHHAALFFSRKTGGASLLSGGDWFYKADESDAESRTWNAAALYTPRATNAEMQVYGKQHLVPFGEYIPFDKMITPLQKLSPVGVSLWPGEAKVFSLKRNDLDGKLTNLAPIKIAPLICFEDTDPALSRKAAKLGAQAVVLITNDSWFSHSQEALQHAWQSVPRAIETGLPVIRVGNSGVTGIIYASGRTRWLEDGFGRPLIDASGAMVEQISVPAKPALTVYSRIGDWPLCALFVVAVFLVMIPLRKNFR